MGRITLSLVGGMLVLALVGCGAQGGQAEVEWNTEEQAVVEVIQRFFQALEAREEARLRMALHPDAVLTRIDARSDSLAVKAIPAEDWMASVVGDGPPLIERVDRVEVHVAGRFADVWAWYDFHIGDALSHCGHDAFQLVRENGQWRILGVCYTIEACS